MPVNRFVVWSSSPSPALGGKAANLAVLESLGLPVPSWYAITTEAFHAALADSGLRGRLARVDDLGAASAEIRGWIAAVPLPSGLEEAIATAHAARIGGDAYVAVRSSAAGEDAAGESFAGLHDSFLFIRGRERLLDAIRRVWASAYNERALAYRRAKGIPFDTIAVAVVVQRMIEARTSGVLFTANPNTGSVHEVVISSLWGAGEGLVSAGFDADTYVVDKETLEVSEAIAAKTEQLVLNREAGGGLVRTAVPDELRERSSLAPAEVQVLARMGLAIERHYRRPQDLEFAVDAGGKPFLLQARPVTTVEELGPAAGNRLIWDNSNIIESYSGVTSPMTFSFIRRAYSIVYHCFAEVMGIDARTVRANREVFENMLGLFRGQVYYNLFNWYRLVRLFPGFNYNKSFMESMMGVREAARMEENETPEATGLQRYTVELPALLRLVGRSARNFLHIRRIVGDFQSYFREHYERWSALDFRAMAPHELAALYRQMEEKLLWEWKAPIINDFFVMVFYGTLKKLCVSWCGDDSGSLQNDLICGEGGIESTEPTRMLLRLAAEARQTPELRQRLLDGHPEDLAREIPADPRFSDFNAQIRRYLDLYGFRCVNELKLEEFSLRDRPAFLYQILRNYLAMEDPAALDVAAMEHREQGIRRAAEEKAFTAVRGPLRRWVFRRVLENARLGVKNRENLRFARTRIYGLLRELLRAVGEDFTEAGLLDQTDDVFYLTLDEVWDYVKGRAVTTNLKGLAALRREEFDAYRRMDPPADRFETFGLPYHRNRFQGRPKPAASTEPGLLTGTGCCPGVVTGPVKVLRTPSEDARLDGEILVAERTDPGWVPLYPSVSGLLIERGSILSHSAIVAREMGIPTIVGIAGLVGTLKTGQIVTMDGAAGTVRISEP
ncbi:MAG TPA: phosphoenolpyruvate synthase [Thermoanaerobaculia bacterium]|jgi:pyruvate,water dikinase|nr:phosphoenolpyruvate synthase [Thermoanaerobaculia bacterium]